MSSALAFSLEHQFLMLVCFTYSLWIGRKVLIVIVTQRPKLVKQHHLKYCFHRGIRKGKIQSVLPYTIHFTILCTKTSHMHPSVFLLDAGHIGTFSLKCTQTAEFQKESGCLAKTTLFVQFRHNDHSLSVLGMGNIQSQSSQKPCSTLSAGLSKDSSRRLAVLTLLCTIFFCHYCSKIVSQPLILITTLC